VSAARSSAAALLVAAAALTASACATPEGDPSMYHDEALSTLSAAQSEVVTVQIVLTTRLRTAPSDGRPTTRCRQRRGR
jgi:hypothetical protein